MTIPTRAWLLLLTIGLLTYACSRSPVVRYHTLQPITSEAKMPLCSKLAVGIGPAKVARYLDRPEIVRRSGATRIEYDPQNRWAEGLESEILNVLGRNLTTLLESNRIVVYPSDVPFPLAYRVMLEVSQFDTEPGGDLVLRVRWILHGAPKEDVLAVELTEIRRSDAPSESSQLVQGYSDALGELSHNIVERICQLEALSQTKNQPSLEP